MFFFFFKQKTAYEMRISDWSSDVCSSDLLALAQVDRDGLARTDLPLFEDLALVDADHAGLGAANEQPVPRERVAQRAQPVAVHAGHDPAPAEAAHRGRPVPRLDRKRQRLNSSTQCASPLPSSARKK